MSYRSKAIDSFKTKYNLFVFNQVINNINTCEIEEFRNFQINDDIIKLYTTEYWQGKKEFKISKKTIQEIYLEIQAFKSKFDFESKGLQEYYIKNEFAKLLTEADYSTLIAQKNCHYCKITKEEINVLAEKKLINKKNLRGYTLEIDRLNSNKEYYKENCVMACYWCNNAKTDEFTQEEFLIIGKEIRNVFMARLKS